ncbi:unnamed protein product, partial [Mesorhabditis belari]|uniref:Uncharacterized protein n=1 Tax=Mesorhabditis belari TaxID=2138241 RepID=A0AAF3J9J2_9BILA
MFFYASPQTRQFISIAYMVMGGLDTILISLTTFVILRKSSQDMRIYKYVQLNIMITTIPELSILKDEKSVLIFDLNEIWFRFYLLWVSVSMTLIIGAMATMKYTILKWLTHQKKHLSPVALAFHNQMILTLFLQAFISFTCSCLPYTAALLSAFGVTGIPDIVTSLCSLYGSFHSAPSCLLILMTTTPYRQYVLNMFDFRLKRTQPVSPNQTTIVFTRWNNGKG